MGVIVISPNALQNLISSYELYQR